MDGIPLGGGPARLLGGDQPVLGGVAGGVAGGDVGVVAPVQAVPLRVKDDGVAGLPAPWKPKLTWPLVAIAAL